MRTSIISGVGRMVLGIAATLGATSGADAAVTVLNVNNPVDIGTTYTLRWLPSDHPDAVAEIRIAEYPLLEPGPASGTVIGSVPFADGEFDWPVCGFAAGQYVFIVSVSASEAGFSNSFTLRGSSTIPAQLTPEPGETIQGGMPYSITWTTGCPYGYTTTAASLRYFDGGFFCGMFWDSWHHDPLGQADFGTGYLNANIPGEFTGTMSADLILRHCGPNPNQCFEQTTPIYVRGRYDQPLVTSPASQVNLAAGDILSITWEAGHDVGLFNIDLGGGPSCHRIGQVSAQAGHFEWAACGMPSGDYLVFISKEPEFWSIRAYAPGIVHIDIPDMEQLPYVGVTSPIGGEVWSWGTTHTITWAMDPGDKPFGQLKITLYRGSEIELVQTVAMAQGALALSLPPYLTPSSDYYFKLAWANCDQDITLGFSDRFEIRPPEVYPLDFNSDGHVDADDMAFFRHCISGPNIPPTDPACLAADCDADQDVDLSDFGIFQRCLSGPGAPINPLGCTR